MTWKMNDKEFEAVSKLPPNVRYEYFIKRVCAWELLWGLKEDDKWVAYGDDGGNKLMPVCPHPRFAAACAVNDWKEAVVDSIELDLWLERWTEGLTRDKGLVAAFTLPSGKGIVLSPERLDADLREELLKYEI